MSAVAQTKALPLVVVIYRVPLFVEALTTAFDDFARVQALRADDPGVGGLLEAFRPDALIVEDCEVPAAALDRPIVHVDLERRIARSRVDGVWDSTAIDLSAEAIRNTILSTLLRGQR